jgi:outer membrane protein OmpA-like peptidoglycan-associated protein
MRAAGNMAVQHRARQQSAAPVAEGTHTDTSDHASHSTVESGPTECACGGTCSECAGQGSHAKVPSVFDHHSQQNPGGNIAAQHIAKGPAAAQPFAKTGLAATPPAAVVPNMLSEAACVTENLDEENRLSHTSPGKIEPRTSPPPKAISFFNYGNDQATPKPAHVRYLSLLRPLLARNHIPVSIEGHASCPGKAAHNYELSQTRAELVASLLEPIVGVVTVKGWGESHPVADNSTADGRSRNRAVDIIPLPPPVPPPSFCKRFPALCHVPPPPPRPKVREKTPDPCEDPVVRRLLPELCQPCVGDECGDDHHWFCVNHPWICILAPVCFLAPEICIACLEDPALCIGGLKCILHPASCTSPPPPPPPPPPPKHPTPVTVLFTPVRAANTPTGANDRIPDKGTTAVAAFVTGWMPPMPPIRIHVAGAEGVNGDFAIKGGGDEIFITGSTFFEVEGIDQTSPSAPFLPLSLQATMGPTPVGQSAPFAVADLMENMSIDLDHVLMTDPSLLDNLQGVLTGVNVVKNASRIGMAVRMTWDSDGANGKKSLDEVSFDWAHQVLTSTGKWTSKPLSDVRGKGNHGYIFESLEDLPMHDPGRRETQSVPFLDDGRSHSVASITNSGFKLEEVIEPDPHRNGCLQLAMSMTGNAGDVRGFRSDAGSGMASATIPIECPRKVKESPLTAATAITIPSLRPQLDQTSYSTGTVTLNSGAASMVGLNTITRFLTQNHPDGSPPDSAQNNIYRFGKIPMRGAGAGNGFSAKEYVKGHLLNEKLGGPGEERNLFPITAEANQDHSREVETDVKRLRNNQALVVMYGVSVSGQDGPYNIDVLGDGTCRYEYLNADLHCTYGTYTLYTDNTVEPLSITNHPIHSTFDLAGFISRVAGKNCPEK